MSEERLRLAGRHIAQAQLALGPEMRDASPGMQDCWDELNWAAVALHDAGVPVGLDPSRPAPVLDPLAQLRKIEQGRAEGEALLEALGELLPVAEALDKARGDWVGDMAATHLGETPGTNYAEMIQEMHLRLKHELRGIRGSGRE